MHSELHPTFPYGGKLFTLLARSWFISELFNMTRQETWRGMLNVGKENARVSAYTTL